MSDIYGILAPYYDRWNRELDYSAWADAIEKAFRERFSGRVASVLDLACGTGRMTIELAKRGYDMIGVDRSTDMLGIARDKAEAAGVGRAILWVCQGMTDFELYGTVEAVVCCLDSLNHLTENGELFTCFSLVRNYLVPDGLFLFDMNSRRKFETVYTDRTYSYEAPGVFCTWQNRYSPSSHLCDFGITLFRREKESGLYRRYEETETERMYPLVTVKRELAKAGFELIGITSSPEGGELTGEEDRWYFLARAKKETVLQE